MTSVLFLLTGIAVTAIPAAVARGLQAEANHWRLIRLEYTRVDVLCHDKDHFERLARRRQRRVRHLTAQLAQVTPAQPRRPVYADFAYGANR